LLSDSLILETDNGKGGILQDSTGNLHLSLVDEHSGCLNYLTDASGEWTTTVLDCPGKIDEASFLYIDSNQRVHIFYADLLAETLKVATNGDPFPSELPALPNLWNESLLYGAKGQKTWTSPGNYLVKSQARCATDTSIESAWSPTLSVVISAPAEGVTSPSIPTGPASGTTGILYGFFTGGSVSTLGHLVEYQFDWSGNETDLSPWGDSNQSKTWTQPGTYSVKARARCKTHPEIKSIWSGVLSVNITTPAGPDLSGQWPELVPSCTTTMRGTQCKVTGKFKVQNIGNKDTSGSFFMLFYLSEGQTFLEGNAILLKKVSSGKLKAGVSKTIRITALLPKSLTTSGKYIFAIIDPGQSVLETNEANNAIQYGPMP
jgi:hypothetical protein